MGCSGSKDSSATTATPASPKVNVKAASNKAEARQSSKKNRNSEIKASDVAVSLQGAVTKRKSSKITNKKSALLKLDVFDNKVKLPMVGPSLQYNISYCYAAQRGYYPNAPDKANQDSYLLHENFMDDPCTHLFGVFDGHGEYGDLCSYYCSDTVLTYIIYNALFPLHFLLFLPYFALVFIEPGV